MPDTGMTAAIYDTTPNARVTEVYRTKVAGTTLFIFMGLFAFHVV